MNKDHIKQHYIPQFIIRSFCNDDKVFYYDKKNKRLVRRWPKEIFEEENLYKYIEYNKEDSNKIEKDLAN